MNPVQKVLVPFVLGLLLIGTLLPSTAQAKDVNATIVAASIAFHLGSASGTSPPTISAAPGDVLRLRIENHDATWHTLTVPHFGVDAVLDNGSASNPTVIFVNITTTTSDAGTWQIWCRPHSSGTTPETHAGMVGTIRLETSTPPPTPGFDVFAVVGALAAAFVVLRTRRRA